MTFTNLTDETVQVLYGLFTNNAPDGAREIAPGASVRIKTEYETLGFSASSYESGDQDGSVDLPSECATKDSKRTGNAGSWNKGPRVAPAAGVTDSEGTLGWGTTVAAAVLALGALALGRRFTTR